MGKNQKIQVGFSYALKSFIGYLEGTHKSAHTIKNYRLDVLAFQNFLNETYAKAPTVSSVSVNSTPSLSSASLLSLDQINHSDIERYREYLKEKGFKTNTRRRKILTVTQFLSYLAKRKKLSPEMAKKSPAPHKIERIPYTVSAPKLVELIRELPTESLLDARNRALLWTLAEAGCLVSEVTQLRFEDFKKVSATAAAVFVPGKSARMVPVSLDLLSTIQELGQRMNKSQWIFLGFNKYGSLGAPMTPRAVELLVKYYGPHLGFPNLTPRTFRHSVILSWFERGIPQNEIQTRLGLKTTYAFRSYMPLLKSSSETTSTDGKPQTEV